MSQPTDIIGDVCDFGGCSAPQRVVTSFVDGELGMCGHHWRASEDVIIGLPGFVRVVDRVFERPPVGVA